MLPSRSTLCKADSVCRWTACVHLLRLPCLSLEVPPREPQSPGRCESQLVGGARTPRDVTHGNSVFTSTTGLRMVTCSCPWPTGTHWSNHWAPPSQTHWGTAWHTTMPRSCRSCRGHNAGDLFKVLLPRQWGQDHDIAWLLVGKLLYLPGRASFFHKELIPKWGGGSHKGLLIQI